MATKNKNTTKKTFPVLNMSCASCANSAQTVVRAQEGVVSAEVNYGTGNLTVEYLPNIIDTIQIQKAVQSAGYDLLIEEENKQQETLEALHKKEYQKLKTKTVWAIMLSLPVFVYGMFFMNAPYANEIMWLFATPVVLWFGRDFLSTP